MNATDPAPAMPRPKLVCDGGDLDCGSGLLLIVARALASLPSGATLELRSREASVRDDLPAWCASHGHTLLDIRAVSTGSTSFLISKSGGTVAVAPAVAAPQTVSVQRDGSAWITATPPGDATAPVGHVLIGVAACLSIAVGETEPGRRLAVDRVEVSLDPSIDDDGALTGVVGTVRFTAAAELSSDEHTALLDDALARSPLARSLQVPIALTVVASD